MSSNPRFLLGQRQALAPDETREFERAVTQARERLEDLSPLLVVANRLDQAADLPARLRSAARDRDGSAA